MQTTGFGLGGRRVCCAGKAKCPGSKVTVLQKPKKYSVIIFSYYPTNRGVKIFTKDQD